MNKYKTNLRIIPILVVDHIFIYIVSRQKEHLTQIISASGYQDKVPPRIREENVAKLSSLMQELLSFEQASQHLERDIAAEQEHH